MEIIAELTEAETISYGNQNILRNLSEAVQRHLDDTVKAKGYDNIISVCTYANSNNPTFKNEGLACVEWRDAVWGYCLALLDDVQNGIKPIPSQEELISSLPVLNW